MAPAFASKCNVSVSNFKDELDLIRQVREETLSERHASASVDRADIAPRSPSGVSVDVAVIFILAFIIDYHFVLIIPSSVPSCFVTVFTDCCPGARTLAFCIRSCRKDHVSVFRRQY